MKIYEIKGELREGFKPSPVYKNFYVHPTVENLMFNLDGLGILKTKCMPLKYKTGKWGYLTLNGVIGLDTSFVHVAVAETFYKNYYADVNHLVNHIDGIKTNPEAINLEWCTPSMNLIHAFETGLRSDNIRTDVKNLKTGETFNFRSITEAANFIGVNRTKVAASIKSGYNKKFVIRDVFEVKREDQPWSLTKHAIGKNAGSAGLGVVINKIGSDEHYLFSSIPQASEFIGVKAHIIYSSLNNGSCDITKYGYNACRFCDTELPISEMIDKRIEKPKPVIPRNPPKPITVSHPKWPHRKIYGSTQEFADEIGVKKNTIQRSVCYNGGWYRNYYIEYGVPTSRKRV